VPHKRASKSCEINGVMLLTSAELLPSAGAPLSEPAGSVHFDLNLFGLGALSYRKLEFQHAILELKLDISASI